MVSNTLLMIGGLVSGFINGLLGTGGGIVLVFLLGRVLKNTGKKDIFATTLTVTLALSAVSAFIYMQKGSIEFNLETLKYAGSAVVGGFIGAYLLNKLKVGFVKKVFGVLVIIAGANMAGLI